MNEIEKMYENASIKKIELDYPDNFEPFYPEFTAEKQLELIKWLIQKYKIILIEHKINLFYIHIRDIYTGEFNIELDEALAGLINNLWQDLTEEERKQIKEILQ